MKEWIIKKNLNELDEDKSLSKWMNASRTSKRITSESDKLLTIEWMKEWMVCKWNEKVLEWMNIWKISWVNDKINKPNKFTSKKYFFSLTVFSKI